MALLINQGKQDTTQDNKFNPIVAQNVMLEITELKLAKTQANTLEVTLRVLDGPYKNRFVFDRVTFDATSPMAWKYRQLRKCAGVAYQDGEPANIDIEELLLHKAVRADLGIRKGKNKDGVEQDYQDVKYKMSTVQPTPVAPTQAQPQATAQPGSVFGPAPTQAPAPAKTKKKAVVAEPAPAPVDAPQVDIDDESDWD